MLEKDGWMPNPKSTARSKQGGRKGMVSRAQRAKQLLEARGKGKNSPWKLTGVRRK